MYGGVVVNKNKLDGVFEQITDALEERKGSDRRGDEPSSDRRSESEQPAVVEQRQHKSDRRQHKERRDVVE